MVFWERHVSLPLSESLICFLLYLKAQESLSSQ